MLYTRDTPTASVSSCPPYTHPITGHKQVLNRPCRQKLGSPSHHRRHTHICNSILHCCRNRLPAPVADKPYCCLTSSERYGIFCHVPPQRTECRQQRLLSIIVKPCTNNRTIRWITGRLQPSRAYHPSCLGRSWSVPSLFVCC